MSGEGQGRASYLRPHPLQVAALAMAHRKGWVVRYAPDAPADERALETCLQIELPDGFADLVLNRQPIEADGPSVEVNFRWWVIDRDPDEALHDVRRALGLILDALGGRSYERE